LKYEGMGTRLDRIEGWRRSWKGGMGIWNGMTLEDEAADFLRTDTSSIPGYTRVVRDLGFEWGMEELLL
jgi:hypothetical protein